MFGVLLRALKRLVRRPEKASGNDRLAKMIDDTDEALRVFAEGYSACLVRTAGGELGLNTSALRSLIRENRSVAARSVEYYCALAQSNPVLFQRALMVAVCYALEFKDESLAEAVADKARAAGAEHYL